jgi:hypothetical protein
MIRLGLHTGLRQRNLRELLLCPRDREPMPEGQLAARRAGELRWNSKYAGWEVFIPAVSFKNGHSSFFNGKPFRLQLPNLENLYSYIQSYVERHRPRLLRGKTDPGTFFVKTVKATSVCACYNQETFYEAWRRSHSFARDELGKL